MELRQGFEEAALHMSDLVGALLSAGASGWIAVRLADGDTDGLIYFERRDAEADQGEPCAFVHLPDPRWDQFDCPVTISECADYLRATAVLRGMTPERTPVLLRRGGGLIGLPEAPYRSEYCKVIRYPSRRPARRTVVSTEMFRDLTTLLTGEGAVGSTDGSAVYLSIREPNRYPCEISYTPTGATRVGSVH